jgi:hypothetical protein
MSSNELSPRDPHALLQTVESVSYRLEDLKSGSIKVFRVLES